MNKITRYRNREHTELRPGLVKTNLSYNDELMLCHFTMAKGARIELHNHKAVQNGYVLAGRLKYQIADSGMRVLKEGIVEAGDGYVWDSEEYHSFEALQDSEFIECFAPCRPEYVPDSEKQA